MHLQIQEKDIDNLEVSFEVPSDFILFYEDDYYLEDEPPNTYNFIWICNYQKFDRYVYLMILKPKNKLIEFALIVTTNDKVQYSVRIGKKNFKDTEYVTGDGLTIGKPILFDYSGIFCHSIDNTYICKIKFDNTCANSKNFLKSFSYTQLDEIYRDFGKLVNSNTFSDVILKISDIEYSAHRNILSARSPVFAAMFSNDMKEAREGKVGDVNIKAIDLYKAAHKYKLTGLMEICTDIYGILFLKSHALHFIKSKPKDVIELPEFDNLKNTNPELVMEVLKFIVGL